MSIDLPVSDFMARELLECSPATPVGEAAALMRTARCGSILVVEQGRAVGIWTETDALSGNWQSIGDLEQPVSLFMSSPVKTMRVGTSLGEAARRFRQEGVRHLLIVDDDGRHLGMVSQTDVVQHQGAAFFIRARNVLSVIHEAPVSAAPDFSFSQVRELMQARRVDALVVHDGARCGIITARDVIAALGARQVGVTAGELASFPLLTIARDARLYQARELFAKNHIRHLGVVDDQQVLIGLLTFNDILESVEHDYVKGLLVELEQQADRLQETRREVIRQMGLTEAILNALPINVFVKDTAGRLIVANEMMAQTIGRPLTDIIGRTDGELFLAEVASRHREDDEQVRLAKRTLVREESLPDGRLLLAQKRLIEVDGESLLIGASMDVTDWKRADALLVSGHHVLELIAGGAELNVVLEALCKRMETHLPGAICSVLLLDADGVHLRHVAGSGLPVAYAQAIDGVAIGPLVGSCGTAAFTGEQVIVPDIASSPLWVDYSNLAERHGLRACWSTPFFSAGNKVLGTFAIYYHQPRKPDYNDMLVISHGTRLAAVAVERWQQIAELKRLATTDLLTGLCNRAHFMDSAEVELRRADRFNRDLSVLMLDIDFFKRINDQHGHAAGDEALRSFSRVLIRETRVVDLLGRIGGEEFTVVLPETGREEASLIAERLRKAVEKASFVFHHSAPISFTVSIGVALLQAGDCLDSLLARADKALYLAKHSGRNRVEQG
jgi:diguanylate cyclase (GGDEF)-like protein